MVDVIRHASELTGIKPLDLQPIWDLEVKRAVALNNGEFDSRSFIIATKSFLERLDITLPTRKYGAFNENPYPAT